jgi:hypothetical protein
MWKGELSCLLQYMYIRFYPKIYLDL